jgi:hypothetical protein
MELMGAELTQSVQLVWATIQNYNRELSGFAREPEQAIQSISCNPIKSTESKVQRF